MIAEIQSKGLYSTWLYLPQIATLIDCGEGAASSLQGRANAIRRIVISHDHTDHISGLDTFINARNLGSNPDAPLEIFYPKGSTMLPLFKDYIMATQPVLHFSLKWKSIEPQTEIPLPPNKILRAFKVQHGSAKALGFSILEERTRLKKEFQGLDQKTLEEFSRNQEKDTITETYRKKLLVYSGDAWRMPLEEAKGTDYLFHDCTFLKAEDRLREDPKSTPTHATLAEVMEFSAAANVKKATLLHHISPRYNRADVETAQKSLKGKKAHIIPPGKVSQINSHVPGKAPRSSEILLEP